MMTVSPSATVLEKCLKLILIICTARLKHKILLFITMRAYYYRHRMPT